MTQFRIDIVADPSKAVSASKTVERSLGQVENRADSLRSAIGRAFAFVGAVVSVREILSAADAYQNVQNRLRLVTDGTEELASATEQLLGVANRTRSSFQSTAELYTRLSLSARELGRSQEELLQFTESLNQAVILSGASAQEASAGIIQLSQGIASGALRGDELRSVLEQLPAVADVIADHLSVTRGELRKMGEQGRISADIILDAFRDARVELGDKFAKTVPTLSQAFQQFKNEALALVGATDQATGSFQGLAAAISFVSEKMKEAREFYSGFAEDLRMLEAESALSTVGVQINAVNRELKALESRQVISDGALARIEQLRARLAELQGAARVQQKVAPLDFGQSEQSPLNVTSLLTEAFAGLEQGLQQVTTAAEDFVQRFDVKGQLDDLAAEADVLRLVRDGHLAAAEALSIENQLRQQGLDLTEEERARLQVIVETNAALAAQAQAMQNLVGHQQAINAEIAALQQLQASHPELVDEIARRIRELQIAGLETSTSLGDGFSRAFLKMQQEAENLAAVGEKVTNVFADHLTDALVKFAETGKFSFEDFAQSLLSDLTKIIARLLVVQALSALGGATGIIPPIAGGRADGGTVQPGRSFVVGEEGPELFVPSRTGTIVPNAASAPAPVVENKVQVVNVSDPDEIPQAIANGGSDEAIINVLVRNRDRVKQAIG